MKRVSAATFLTWSFAVLMIAGVVHVSSVFLLPSLAGQDSYAKLSKFVSRPDFTILPEPQSGDASLPFTDPGVVLAVCRFDLAENAWRVRVEVDNEALTSLSFRARNGVVFHTLTDRAALRGQLDVLLGTAAQIDAVEASDTDDVQTREVRLTAPSRTGIVIIRAMGLRGTESEGVKRRLNAAACRAA